MMRPQTIRNGKIFSLSESHRRERTMTTVPQMAKASGKCFSINKPSGNNDLTGAEMRGPCLDQIRVESQHCDGAKVNHGVIQHQGIAPFHRYVRLALGMIRKFLLPMIFAACKSFLERAVFGILRQRQGMQEHRVSSLYPVGLRKCDFSPLNAIAHEMSSLGVAHA